MIKKSDDCEYFALVPPKKTPFEQAMRIASTPFRLIRNLFSWPLGRLLSYLVFNPLMPKNEDTEHTNFAKKFPDKNFEKDDEFKIISILDRPGFFHRTFQNYALGTKNFIVHSPFSPFKPRRSLKHFEDNNDAKMHQKIGEFVAELDKGIFSQDKIHFRGLEFLSEKNRATLIQTLKSRFGYDYYEQQKNINFFTLRTETGEELDSVEIKNPKNTHLPIAQQKFVISCMPRSIDYTNCLKQLKILSKASNANVISFNYRGIGMSKGLVWTQDALINDILSQAERLIQAGAKPENIVLQGECLGAALATMACAKLNKENKPVKLYSSRSFRSVSKLLLGFCAPPKDMQSNNPVYYLHQSLNALIYLVVQPLLIFSGWNVNAEKAFISIPAANRDFLCVRSKKLLQNGKKVREQRDDPLVNHEISSIYSLVKEKQLLLQKKKERGEALNDDENNWLADPRSQHKFRVNPEERSDYKKVNGHTCQLRYLSLSKPSSDKNAISGQMYEAEAISRLLRN